MWGRIINAQSKTITSAAIVIGFMSLVSRFLGVFRDRILASQFGVGDSLDIYYAAFRLPDLIFNLIILGAISAGLIPIFSEFIAKDRKEDAWRLISNVLNILTLVLVGCSVVLYFFMPTLMQWLTPGFGSDKIAQVVGLSRIMLISNVFLGISTIFGTILQSFRRFFVYSLAPIFYNVGIILGALYLAPSLGVIGLAWGVVLGAFFHMMIQIAPTFSVGFNYRFIFQWADVAVKEVWTLMIPRTLTLVVNQLNTVIITVVASTMSAGAITIYNLSNNLQSLPLGLFGISFAVAALPTLSLLAAEKKHNEFVSTISATMRQIIFLIVPISIWLYVLRAQVVRVILGAGNFTWQDTRLTAAALALFALSLFAQSIIPLIIRAFYALKNTTKPFLIGVVALGINYVILVFLVWVFSFDNQVSFFISALLKVSDLREVADLRVLALPLSITFTAIIQMFALLITLRPMVGRLDGAKILDSSTRILCASVGSGLAVFGTLRLIDNIVVMTSFLGILAQGIIAGLAGVLGYLALGYLLNIEEMTVFIESARRKLFRLFKIEKGGLDEDVLGENS